MTSRTILSKVRKELLEPFASKMERQLASVVELLKESRPHPEALDRTNNNDNNNNLLFQESSQVPEAVIELVPQPATVLDQSVFHVQDSGVRSTRPPGFLTYTDVPTITTYSIVNAFPQQRSSFVVDSLTTRTTPTFVSGPISSTSKIYSMPTSTIQPTQGFPTEPLNAVLPPQQVLEEPVQEVPTAPVRRTTVVSQLISSLQKDAVVKETCRTSGLRTSDVKLKKIAVPVEVHSSPSVTEVSHHSPPATAANRRVLAQEGFDDIVEAPLPVQSPSQPSPPAEEDPVSIAYTRDPQVIREQLLLWEEAKRTYAREERSETFTPPLPSEPFPETPPPPKYPAPSSPARKQFPPTDLKFWPDELPPPSSVPGLPGIYRAGEVSLPLYMWGLRFKQAEEALNSMGLPLEKSEESPSKRRRLEPSPSREERLEAVLPSGSSTPSVFLPTFRQQPPVSNP